MLTQELHNRRIQIQPALHAIAGSFLMSCGDSDTAVSFAEGRAQLFTPHFHIIMWQVSFLTQAVAEVCLSKHLFSVLCYTKICLLQIMVWGTVGWARQCCFTCMEQSADFLSLCQQSI